jgi:hypothetical protein
MGSMGVSSMPETLATVNADVRVRVKLGGKSEPEFSVGRGIKQGRPRYAVGLFVEAFAHYSNSAHDADCRVRLSDLCRVLQDQSVSLGDDVLTNLLFVDDSSLIAAGFERSKYLLGNLDDFCKATGMAAFAANCEVLVFGTAARERKRLIEAEYQLGGTPMPRCASWLVTKLYDTLGCIISQVSSLPPVLSN